MINSEKLINLIVEPDNDQLLDVVTYAKFILKENNLHNVVFFWNIYSGKFKINITTNNVNLTGYEALKTLKFTYSDLIEYTDLKEDSWIYSLNPKTDAQIKKELIQVLNGMKQKMFEMEMNTEFNEEELLIMLFDITEKNVPYKYNFFDVNPITVWPNSIKNMFLEYFLETK